MVGVQRVLIEGIVFTGANYETIDDFIGNETYTKESGPFKIHTKKGIQRAQIGDIIVKLEKGDFGIINDLCFAKQFEEVHQTIREEGREEEQYEYDIF